ncbi:MAG: hypothetical protein A2Z17_06785 [Gammaproteobacteria bacterium RBG_16_66_13]|nr:MAG: hypothetical protein A2Z17_06785 [Gammaproteobacteria bacterium RBG_16_66_13]
MIAALLLALREGLEAALIISIMFSVLARTRRADLRPAAWSGVVLAAVLSLAAAFGLAWVGAELEGFAEQVFEGVTMILAAGLLTWMIVWMRKQGQQVQAKLETDVHHAALQGHQRAIFAIAFVAVLREGIEMALFLTAAAFREDAIGTVIGGLTGLAIAGLLGWGLYTATLRLNLKGFFQVTGVLLLLVAAGLVAHAVHEFNEAGLIPGLIEPIWDVSDVLGEETLAGVLLKALFGYNANPSLTEAVAYAGYLMAVALALRPGGTRPAGIARATNG